MAQALLLETRRSQRMSRIALVLIAMLLASSALLERL